jgi:hypothetical protein
MFLISEAVSAGPLEPLRLSPVNCFEKKPDTRITREYLHFRFRSPSYFLLFFRVKINAPISVNAINKYGRYDDPKTEPESEPEPGIVVVESEPPANMSFPSRSINDVSPACPICFKLPNNEDTKPAPSNDAEPPKLPQIDVPVPAATGTNVDPATAPVPATDPTPSAAPAANAVS